MKGVGLNPLADRLLIDPDPVPDRTAGGIHIPDLAKDKPSVGTVVAVGPGEVTKDGRLIPPYLSVGDRVVYGKYAGSDVDGEDGKTYRMVRESEVLIRLHKAN